MIHYFWEQILGKPSVSISPANEKHYCKTILYTTLSLWCLAWTLIPFLFVPGVYFDVAENIEWGRYWQFGYDKHPFVSMWISRFFYELVGKHQEIMYLLCGISIAISVLCVWQLSKKMLSPLAALASALLLLTLQYFSSWALEFNNDVIAIATWSAGTLFFYRALERQKISDWLLTAFFCFLAVMTKYYAVVLFAAMGGIVLFCKQGRESFRHWGLYLASILFLLLISPNIHWLLQHDFQPFTYAVESSIRKEPQNLFLLRLIETGNYLKDILERLAFFLVVYFLCFFRKDSKASPSDSYHRFFIGMILLLPLALTACMPLLFGGKIKATWLASCLNFLPLGVFLIRPPRITKQTIHFLLLCISVVGMILAVEFIYSRSVRLPFGKSRACGYEVYPGKTVAGAVEKLWEEHFPDSPLRYVIGCRKTGSFFSLASKYHPHSFLFANPKISPWISVDDIVSSGAVVVWEIRKGQKDDLPSSFLLSEYRQNLQILSPLEVERASLKWVRMIKKGSPEKVRIGVALLPPRKFLSK